MHVFVYCHISFFMINEKKITINSHIKVELDEKRNIETETDVNKTNVVGSITNERKN